MPDLNDILASLGTDPSTMTTPPFQDAGSSKVSARRLMRDALLNFTGSLAAGLSASASAPGGRGTRAGMGAALQYPFVMEQLRKQQEAEAADRKLKLALFLQQVKQQQMAQAADTYKMLTGVPGQEQTMSAPAPQIGGQPSPLPTASVTNTLGNPPINLGNGITATPPTAQDLGNQNLQQLAGQEAIKAQFRPPVPTPNMDPNSPQAVQNRTAGQIAVEQARTPPVKPTTLTPRSMMVDGKPAIVLDDGQGNFLDIATKKPITGQVTPYVAPQRTSATSGNSTQPNDVKDTARGIAEGTISPKISQSVSFRDRTAVTAELRRLGFNQAEAERDWTAINKHLSTLNGAQQERLRQAITFTHDTLPQIEAAYAEWKKQAGISGFKVLNKANLASMKQLPGAAGSAASNLDALIGDFTSELGTVYKGGNSSTDESLKLAGQNLKGEWNEQTFNDSIKRLRTSLQIRYNSISTSEAQGVSPSSPYQPTPSTTGTTGNIIKYDAQGNRIK